MKLYQPLLYLWAAPATMLGLSLVPIAMLQGGRCRIVDGVIEAHGGIITKVLKRGIPSLCHGAAAMTLGHVVWGCDQTALDQTRVHERVHVAQYERWGPFFIPAYLLASLFLKWRGYDPYFDNPFEQEAYAVSDGQLR